MLNTRARSIKIHICLFSFYAKRRRNVGEPQFLKKKFIVSLKKDFVFCFRIYFSTSFAFYFLVSDTQSQTSAMVSFNIETLDSGANLPL